MACQFLCCPRENTARVLLHDGRKYIFVLGSVPVDFLHQPERNASHSDVVKRVPGELPGRQSKITRGARFVSPGQLGSVMSASKGCPQLNQDDQPGEDSAD
jgi:hypothetical protein